MIIGIVSDSHDHLDAARAAVERIRSAGADLLIHAGDFVAPFAARLFVNAGIPVRAVLGNNDGERWGLSRLVPGISEHGLRVEAGGRKIVVIHDRTALDAADAAWADAIVHGHTHAASIDRINGKTFINPGECCGWLTGRRTIAIWDTGSAPEIVGL